MPDLEKLQHRATVGLDFPGSDPKRSSSTEGEAVPLRGQSGRLDCASLWAREDIMTTASPSL